MGCPSADLDARSRAGVAAEVALAATGTSTNQPQSSAALLHGDVMSGFLVPGESCALGMIGWRTTHGRSA